MKVIRAALRRTVRVWLADGCPCEIFPMSVGRPLSSSRAGGCPEVRPG